MQFGLGQIACFRSQDQEGCPVWIEVEVLYTWWFLCRCRMLRYHYEFDHPDDKIEVEHKIEFFKCWWNLGWFPLEER